MATDLDAARRFVAFAIKAGAIRFGEFCTKSGRQSPYFFNAGTLNSGFRLWRVADFYREAIINSDVEFDMLFGPAYKGIPLVVATAIRFAAAAADFPYAFNRKEAKDHGEKGVLVGAPLAGRVLIIDDVITAGLSVRESVDIITSHGAEPCGVVIALDRMEKGETSELSAVQEVTQQFNIPVIAVSTLDDLVGYLGDTPPYKEHQEAVEKYRQQYGVAPMPKPEDN